MTKTIGKCASITSPIDTQRQLEYEFNVRKYNETEYALSAKVHVPKNIQIYKVSRNVQLFFLNQDRL